MSIEKGPGGVTPLMHAVHLNDPSQVSRLLKETKETIDDKDVDGLTALHYAALSGHASIVALLLEAGAHPHSKDKNKNTPLALAIKGGHVDAVVMLEKAENETPVIRPEELPARVVELENIVEQLRQQVAEMMKEKSKPE